MARLTKAERAEALRQKAEKLEAEAHLAERMKDADKIPTCPHCGGRTFKVYTYTTVAQSISYGDEAGEESWDDYESGDHTDLNESATCAECDADAQDVLEQHGWTFYDGPVATKKQAELRAKATKFDEIRAELIDEDGEWIELNSCADAIQNISGLIR